MYPVRRRLVVLHESKSLRELVIRSASGMYEITLATSVSEAEAQIRSAAPLPLLFADPVHSPAAPADGCSAPGSAPSAARVTRFAILYSSVAASLERGPTAEWDPRNILVLGRNVDASGVSTHIRGVGHRAACAMAERFFGRTGSDKADEILAAVVETVSKGGYSGGLASYLGVDRRTVTLWCEKEHLPPPRRLLAWTRVLFAASLLDDPWRRIPAVARLAGYSSDNALRTTLLSFVGSTPRELRRAGALQHALTAFRADARPGRRRQSGAPEESC